MAIFCCKGSSSISPWSRPVKYQTTSSIAPSPWSLSMFIHHETMNVDHFPVAPWVFHISPKSSNTSHPLAPCPPCPELLARLFVAPPARTASPDGRPVRWICPMAAGRTQRSGGFPGEMTDFTRIEAVKLWFNDRKRGFNQIRSGETSWTGV